MTGTRQPNLYSVSTMEGTARAASSVFTVTRTNSEPTLASAITWFTVAGVSAVSVLVMDWTTMGWDPPTVTDPTDTATEPRRALAAIFPPEIIIVAWGRLQPAADFSPPH